MGSHRAQYDAHGNIILPPEEPRIVYEREETAIEKPAARSRALPSPREMIAPVAESVFTLTTQCFDGVRSVLIEGACQYQTSAKDSLSFGKGLAEYGKECLGSCKSFLLQPVWVPGRRGRVKELSRGKLFVLDVFRFGTTFACIFGVLFLALNYQSFTKIMESHFEPIAFGEEGALMNGSTDTLRSKLKKVPGLSVAGVAEGARIGDLLSYLPHVGPPENRIIIPKLNLNVPLVTPSYAALLKEDWTQVETDIQEALQGGVVHYPGTARPGQAGNFFVTGHSSYYPWAPGKFKTVFARLHQLKPGDEYIVYYGGDKHRYVVTERKEVKPSDISVLDQPTRERRATLMTCTPVGTTLRRLIIVAEEVHPETGELLAIGERADTPLEEVKRPALEALPI